MEDVSSSLERETPRIKLNLPHHGFDPISYMSLHDLKRRGNVGKIEQLDFTENLSESSFEKPVRRHPNTPDILVQHCATVRSSGRASAITPRFGAQQHFFPPASRLAVYSYGKQAEQARSALQKSRPKT